MSEHTQTQTTKKHFIEASAAKLPTLVCTGYISAIGEGKPSESGKYNVNPVEINGLGASRNMTVYFLSRPEWFELREDGSPAFNPKSLDKVEGGNGIQFVYRKNIRGKDTISVLEGLAGTPERYADLQDELLSAEGVDGDDSPAVIQKVFENFFNVDAGEQNEIGYVLKQQRTKTEDEDENGKKIYVLGNKYEISDFFEVNKKNLDKYRKAAEKSAKKAEKDGTPITFKVCFDEQETPF